MKIRQWVFEGLRKGIVTTRYPANKDVSPGVSQGMPSLLAKIVKGDQSNVGSLCPTGAITYSDGYARVDYRRCVHCFRCTRGCREPFPWDDGYEWARVAEDSRRPIWPRGFSKSLYIRVVDAGDCGACLAEVKRLNNPYYNMHRLGFFLTPTPRNADILLVVGPVTEQMRRPLLETYEAMPTPKLVMGVGACALTGGVFGPSIFSGAGLGECLPVDIEVPGAPPPPLAVLHALLLAAGRMPSGQVLAFESLVAKLSVG